MTWPDQTPPATDVILHVNVPCAGGSPAYLEIDKLPDWTYRATVGTLFEFQEICRTRDLEALIRQANAMGTDPPAAASPPPAGPGPGAGRDRRHATAPSRT